MEIVGPCRAQCRQAFRKQDYGCDDHPHKSRGQAGGQYGQFDIRREALGEEDYAGQAQCQQYPAGKDRQAGQREVLVV